jgi:hypothetical protein
VLSIEAALNVVHELYRGVRERFRDDPIVPLQPTEPDPLEASAAPALETQQEVEVSR